MPIEYYCPECAHVLKDPETYCLEHPHAEIQVHEWPDAEPDPTVYTCDFCQKVLTEAELTTHTC